MNAGLKDFVMKQRHVEQVPGMSFTYFCNQPNPLGQPVKEHFCQRHQIYYTLYRPVGTLSGSIVYEARCEACASLFRRLENYIKNEILC